MMNNLEKELLTELGRTQIQLLGLANKLSIGEDKFLKDSIRTDFIIFQKRRRMIVELLNSLGIYEETDEIPELLGACLYLEREESNYKPKKEE